MGLCNIQHPKTKMWRQWSTYSDSWNSDWMSETDYKEFLIKQTVEQMRQDFDKIGIVKAKVLTNLECDYVTACRKHCDNCDHSHCDDCDYLPSAFEYYKQKGDDYLNIGLNSETEDNTEGWQE